MKDRQKGCGRPEIKQFELIPDSTFRASSRQVSEIAFLCMVVYIVLTVLAILNVVSRQRFSVADAPDVHECSVSFFCSQA